MRVTMAGSSYTKVGKHVRKKSKKDTVREGSHDEAASVSKHR
jgi:hypothetical protein